MNDPLKTEVNHAMLDFETLSVEPNAIVLSIGAVVFSPYQSESIDDILNNPARHFYRNIEIDPQMAVGRHLSGDTVRWWMKQGKAATDVLDNDLVHPNVALTDYTAWIDSLTCKYQWSNGSDFDNVILRTLYRDLNLKSPFTHRQHRCARSFIDESGVDGPQDERLIKHYALHDCIYQVVRLQNAYRKLGLSGVVTVPESNLEQITFPDTKE